MTECDLTEMANIKPNAMKSVNISDLSGLGGPEHLPCILPSYCPVRENSYSRAAAEESARVLRALSCETKTYNPSGQPLPDNAPIDHPKVAELRELALWCEDMVW
jgi:arsenic resistance protein ArsH